MTGKRVLGLVILVAASGCTPFQTTSQTQTAIQTTASAPVGSPFLGDVDGDGRADRVVLEGDRVCDWRLAVRTRRALHRVPVEMFCGKAAATRIIGLAEIDGERGFEVVVEHDHGASRSWGDAFTFERGGLRSIRENDRELLWETGGSVGTGSTAVDCAGEPGLIVRSYVDHRKRKIRRTWWRIEGVRIRPERAEIRSLSEQAQLPEFRSTKVPLGSCRWAG